MTRHEHYQLMIDQRHAMTLPAIFERYCCYQDDIIDLQCGRSSWPGFIPTKEQTVIEAKMNSLKDILFPRFPETFNFPWRPT